MRRIVFVLGAVVALAGVLPYMVPACGQADEEAAPIFGVRILPGYRDWRLISVAREAGNEVTVVKDATADYSDEEMHAALDVNIPNYASAIVTTDEVVELISSLETSGISARY